MSGVHRGHPCAGPDTPLSRSRRRESFLPLALPCIGEEEIEEVVQTLRSGWLTTGPRTKRFEEAFARAVKSRNAIAVNSGTGAMHVALAALGIGPGDEVILPTFTFCATGHVVAQMGARPVLVDVREDGTMDPEAVARAITPRTKALMPVHYAGQACDLHELYALALQHNLAVIEDAAHAVGASYRGLPLGADALSPEGVVRVTAFSFYANKNMTTGEGGMVTTACDRLASTMRMWALHGMSHDGWKRTQGENPWYYEVVAAGFKYNMSDLQAAIGLHQLAKLERFNESRRRIASLYDAALAGLPGITLPVRHPDRTHVYHLYVIRVDPGALEGGRDQLVRALRARHIGTGVHFIPLHLQPYYQETFGYRPGCFPVAERLGREVVSLPMFPTMRDEDVQDVANAIAEILERG